MILGSSVAGIDSTVVVVALPAIGRNLHVGFQALKWTVTSYTLTLAWLILLAGRLAQRIGPRPPLVAGCLTGGAYTDPAQFRSSFGQISWICAAAFACAAVLSAAFITRPRRSAPAPRPALIQTPVPHLACPVASDWTA
jgi:MFS family permease